MIFTGRDSVLTRI